MSNPVISFVATGRSGLGHLRRVSTIAKAVKRFSPGSVLHLVTNANQDDLHGKDFSSFSEIVEAQRCDMARALISLDSDVVVLDTIAVPDIETTPGRLILVLRETVDHQLDNFSLDATRRWDQVLIPNPASHWMPQLPSGFSQKIDAVGWISRYTGPRRKDEASSGIVIATGGGGNSDTRGGLYSLLDKLIAQARERSGKSFKCRQAIGPRAREGGCLAQADEIFDPGPELHRVFQQADVVVSTAGYNSVLELATTDTPTMLVPIPRTYDNQALRAARWGPRLGCCLMENTVDLACTWLVQQIEKPERRSPVELGASGDDVAAKLILGVQ